MYVFGWNTVMGASRVFHSRDISELMEATARGLDEDSNDGAEAAARVHRPHRQQGTPEHRDGVSALGRCRERSGGDLPRDEIA
ncbi:hypothetical protein [Tropicimonas isoalkanivorans]|uniref:Uncharacterized protein n=1 Tax=Tropicimonas isoalkanivorans TaxID=441112 RepID=A0A1I1GLI7_9RHOB|nr:hypothetical protein [Tropicimonas isoalkanivorans]SFC10738.1 hypothetical protein SAMN04488094_102566 [Tropicimonas isoalkanivorans]